LKLKIMTYACAMKNAKKSIQFVAIILLHFAIGHYGVKRICAILYTF
jgi:hypothetical protein